MAVPPIDQEIISQTQIRTRTQDRILNETCGQTDWYSLLMESTIPNRTPTMHEHIIDISSDHNAASSSNSHNNNNREEEEFSDRDGEQGPRSSSSSSSGPAISNLQNPTFPRRGDRENLRRRHRSPLNSGLWISIELVVNLSQVVAAIVVLSLSKHEHPRAPLFEWVIGYTVGCIMTLPHLYWRYVHRNRQVSDQEAEPTTRHGSTSQNNSNNQTEANSYTAVSTSNSRLENHVITRNPRVHALVDHFKMALDSFFAVWFVVGNVWIFGGRSSSSVAPNLYRLCIAFLTFSCIGYAMPFILCAMICCCLPCIISLMGFREDLNHNRGATQESINVLPVYKFRLKRISANNNRETSEIYSDSQGVDGGGIIGAGTDKERIVSAEDAVCCICLAKYADNDELRELTCEHFFHKECVDKWLKINALCPLCKAEVANSSTGPLGLNFGRRHIDRRVGNGVES